MTSERLGNKGQILLERLLAVHSAHKVNKIAHDVIVKVLVVGNGQHVVAIGHKGHMVGIGHLGQIVVDRGTLIGRPRPANNGRTCSPRHSL